ncbi:MAG: glucosaminidase domain-containing protein [Xanthomonadaceae bacterium]|nr:glucosaminidase domain-containing protein [Xanthomonadaceae bacterium]
MARSDAISPLSELGGLSRLSEAAARRDPAAVDAVARRFEALFAEMMVSSMRSASLGDPLFEGQNPMFREMYDREVASSLTAGRGLGIAEMLRRQLAPPAAAEAPPNGQGFPLSPALDARALPLGAPRPSPVAVSPAPTHAVPTAAAPPPSIAAVRTLAPSLPPLPAMPTWLPDPQLAAIGDAVGTPADATVVGLPQQAPVADALPPRPAVPANLSAAKPGTPEAFVAEVWPHAQAAAAELGVDPRMLVAQAALETGWGRSVMRGPDGRPSHNLFGIKATGGWQGAAVSHGMVEFRGGVMQRERASFRAYGSVGESFADYVRLVRDNPRYREAVAAGTDGARFAEALERAGYATDPQYAEKLKAIAGGPTLRRALASLPLAPTQEA